MLRHYSLQVVLCVSQWSFDDLAKLRMRSEAFASNRIKVTVPLGFNYSQIYTRGRGLVMSCSLVDIYRRFGRRQCFCLRDNRASRVWEIRLRSTAVTVPRLERYRCRHNIPPSPSVDCSSVGRSWIDSGRYRMWWQGSYVWRKRFCHTGYSHAGSCDVIASSTTVAKGVDLSRTLISVQAQRPYVGVSCPATWTRFISAVH